MTQAAAPPSHSTLTEEELPQAKKKKKKILCLCMHGRLSHFQFFATLWTVAYSLLCRRGFSRQEYQSLLANTGCHNLLEHCISCCPSHQLS